MIIDLHPEFGLELALGITYAYWLHKRGELEGVHTVEGMKPFYYFCDSVEEKYDHRTIDNEIGGLNSLPNNWIHHNAIAITGKDYSELTLEEQNKVNGVLDYSKWEVPPYKDYYKDTEFKFDKPMVVVSNRYNLDHGEPPLAYLDVEILYKIFNYLTENGYGVIYKRPDNTEFPLDQNEINGIRMGYKDIIANVDGVGEITDYQLTEYYDDVFLLNDLIKAKDSTEYNTKQLQIFSLAKGFITMGGGGSLLCSMFGVPNISLINSSTECNRKGYYEGPDNYYRKMSDHDFYPILDSVDNIKNRGYRDYTKLIKKIKEVF